MTTATAVMNARQIAVLNVIQVYGPFSDEELIRRYNACFAGIPGKAQTDSGIRTRRSELVTLGRVRDSGRLGTTKTGRPCTVWQAA